MLKRPVFVAAVALAALSGSAVTAFADSPPTAPNPTSAASCTTTSNRAALLARLRNDQAALDAARARLTGAQAQLDQVQSEPPEGHQPWLRGDVQNKQAEVANLEAVVQADQAGLKQTPACQRPTGNNSPSSASTPAPSPRAADEAPGLPQTGAVG